jgi:predicted DNA-binding transcriptional regulator AlpA
MDITLLNERQNLGYFNIHEVAKLLNINYQTIRGNIRRGDIPRPSLLIGRRLYYSSIEVETLAGIFGARKRYKAYHTYNTNCPGDPTVSSGI